MQAVGKVGTRMDITLMTIFMPDRKDVMENTCGCKPMFLLQEQHKESGASRAVQAADAWQLRKAKQNQAVTSNKYVLP